MFEWKPEYSVKINTIDGQHQTLFGLARELSSAMDKGKGNTVMASVLDRLVSYTISHFKAEEDLMARYKYPRLAEHKAEHEALTKKVRALLAEMKAGRALLTIDVMDFLQDWLAKHIQRSDMHYAEFINRRAAA
jgi:hemerythrin-like metal-binding protein